jgi:hypothetical protein
MLRHGAMSLATGRRMTSCAQSVQHSLVSSHRRGCGDQLGIYPQHSMKWKDVMKHTNIHAPGGLRNHNFSNHHHYQYYYINVPGHRLLSQKRSPRRTAVKHWSPTCDPRETTVRRTNSSRVGFQCITWRLSYRTTNLAFLRHTPLSKTTLW